MVIIDKTLHATRHPRCENTLSCREAGVRRSAVQDHSSGVAGAILAAARLEVWIGLTAIARQRPKQPVARKKGYDRDKGCGQNGLAAVMLTLNC